MTPAHDQRVALLDGDRRAQFSLPRVDRPLQRDIALSAIPRGATIAGMFPQNAVAAAAAAGLPLSGARPRYTPFSFYPLHEHLALLLEASALFFPGVSPRRAMRKLGRSAVAALMESTVGRVLLASATDPLSALEAFCKAYAVNMKPGHAEVIEHGDGWAIVRLEQVYLLPDCHQPGAFEGLMARLFDLHNPVRVHLMGPGTAELLVEW